jgi:putative ABC transport system substrate-binding protein
MTTLATLRSGVLPAGAGCVRQSILALLAVAVLLLVRAAAAEAQPAPRVYRVGFVGSSSSTPQAEVLRHGLRELGYVEGKNLILEARFAEGRSERLPELVAEVLRLKIDVLVVGSTPAARAAKRATTTVPIVFASLFDPVGSGIVASLGHPGGNITGAAIGVGGSGLAGKWVELLKEAVPEVSQVAVLWNSGNPASATSRQEVEAAARTLKVKVDMLDTGNAAALDRALTTIAASGAQALLVTNDPFFTPNRAKLVQFAESRRLPAVYFFKSFAEAGGLMAYGASTDESYRKAAAYVDKILRGARPADLPIEQPTRFELVINLRTAKALRLTIPQSLLLRADQLIE